VGENSALAESQIIVFAAEIFFPWRSPAVCQIVPARDDKLLRINEIEVLKIKTRWLARFE
jgi:hypothetical protein